MSYRTVTIVGAGLLGHAIAVVHALGGCRVRLNDIAPEPLAAARQHIAAALETLRRAGAITADAVAAAVASIEYGEDLASACADADLIVEAITEDIDKKAALYAAIDRYAGEHAVIASNTSYLDVFPLAPASRQSRFMIVHWYTPPYIIDLVDIVGSEGTDPREIARMRAFLESIGKKPIVLDKFVTGYIANRLQSAIGLEIYHLLDEGLATPEQIDMSIRYGLAERLLLLGHLGKCDYSGLRLVQKTLANAVYRPPAVRGFSTTVDRLVDAGRVGVMSGAGFYDYGESSPQELQANRDIKLIALKAAVAKIEATPAAESGATRQ